jgi:hypothetical protein
MAGSADRWSRMIPGILATPGSGPLSGAVAVAAGEIATIRQSIKRFNTIIQAEADEVATGTWTRGA